MTVFNAVNTSGSRVLSDSRQIYKSVNLIDALKPLAAGMQVQPLYMLLNTEHK